MPDIKPNRAAVQKIIDHYSNGKSPVNADQILAVADKYQIPVELILAQGIHESHFGTKGRAARTNNIFNVGNTTPGDSLPMNHPDKSKYDHHFNTWDEGLDAYGKLISSRYLKGKSVDDLMSNFVNASGNRYAENKDYEKNLSQTIKGFSRYGLEYSPKQNSAAELVAQGAAEQSPVQKTAFSPQAMPQNQNTTARKSAKSSMGYSAADLIASALDKDPSQITSADVQAVAKSKGYSDKQIKNIMKGFEQSNGNDIFLDDAGKSFNTVSAGSVAGKSGKKTGNRKGFDAGDVVGLGRNVNFFAGLAGNLIGDYEDKQNALNAKEKAAADGANMNSGDYSGVSGMGNFFKPGGDGPQINAPSGAGKSYEDTLITKSKVNNKPVNPADELTKGDWGKGATNIDTWIEKRAIRDDFSPGDRLLEGWGGAQGLDNKVFGNSEQTDNLIRLNKQVHKEGTKQILGRENPGTGDLEKYYQWLKENNVMQIGEPGAAEYFAPSAYAPGAVQGAKVITGLRAAKLQKAKDIFNSTSAEAKEMAKNAPKLLSEGAQGAKQFGNTAFNTVKEATNRISTWGQQAIDDVAVNTEKALASGKNGLMSRVNTLTDDVASGFNKIKTAAEKRFAEGAKKYAAEQRRKAAAAAARKAEIDGAASASYNMDGFRKGGKLPMAGNGLKIGGVPAQKQMQDPLAGISPALLMQNPKQSTFTDPLKKMNVAGPSMGAQPTAPQGLQGDGTFNSNAKDSQYNSTTKGGPGEGGGIDPKVLNTAGDIVQYAIPAATTYAAMKHLNKSERINVKPVSLMQGNVSSLSANFAKKASSPSADIYAQIAGDKFENAQLNQQQNDFNLQNQQSILAQRDKAVDRFNQEALYNSQSQNQANQTNAYMDFQKRAMGAGMISDLGKGYFSNMERLRTSAATIAADKEARQADAQIRYGTEEERAKGAKHYTGRKGGKLTKFSHGYK